MSLQFPYINPVALAIGPLTIHWYALAYITGILGGFLLIKKQLLILCAKNTEKTIDFLLTISLSILLGGRIGYSIFYSPLYFINNPFDVIKLWEGGMSFHGGILGCLIGTWIFCKKNKYNLWKCLDLLALVAPIGIGLGRIGNFINAELYGRVTNLPWGIIFPTGGPLPRHPSQLYEAGLEGVLLGICMFILLKYKKHSLKPGMLACIFSSLYSLFRFFIEFFREPDFHIGLLYFKLSLGQYLCIIMLCLSMGVYYYLSKNKLLKKNN